MDFDEKEAAIFRNTSSKKTKSGERVVFHK
jgi:hypothetical protein